MAEAAFAVDHEQAASVADVLLRRTRLGLLDARRLCEPDAEGPVGRGAGDGRTARLGRRARRAELELWDEEARAEGIVPAAAPVPVPDRGPEEPSPTAPGAAPEEAA